MKEHHLSDPDCKEYEKKELFPSPSGTQGRAVILRKRGGKTKAEKKRCENSPMSYPLKPF